ncbi:MAG: S-methyl-5-thioribose-1-phosphate isomerase [Saprospiraceae bacterium]|nr:S-methyl-5-thioribose-1-phosphate isomerase [Saprospiraceae bacterium]
MKINGKHHQTIWLKDERTVQTFDQRFFPHQIVIEDLTKLEDFEVAIKDMHVRGAPLIGVTAAYGLYIAALEALEQPDFEHYFINAVKRLRKTRPTAVDLFHAIEKVVTTVNTAANLKKKPLLALEAAKLLAEESIASCSNIGEYGLKIIKEIASKKKGELVNILTHCNAGWIACIDYGTATAPIYLAHDAGIPVHVWVDETRPRNQGANLTAFELGEHGVPHTVITDNTGGHLMQHKMVDMVIVGTDRTTRQGDVANKIGTYLKALAAKDNDVPFYVALPSSSIDWNVNNGLTEIPIEQRNPDEVKYVQGWDGEKLSKVLITPKDSPAANYGFDVTPARLVTGLITDRGICEASEEGLLSLFPEKNESDVSILASDF